MACQQRQKLLSNSCDNEPPLPLLSPALAPTKLSRPPGNCVMDIDSQHEHKHHNCNLPSLNPKQKKRRTVSFQPRSLLFCYGISVDETQDWYTGEDEGIFKVEARKELAIFWRMKQGYTTDASGKSASNPQHHRNLCIVGLEQDLISPAFSRERVRTKKLVKCAVLLEQSKIGTGYDDSDKAERIAQAARRYSEWSAAQAKMFGDFQYKQSKES